MTDLSLWQRARRKAADKIKIGLAPFALERGALSVTFDDFPRSAWETGGEILAKFGVLGTYYVSGGLADRLYRDIPHFTAGDLEAIAAAGHEIGCHTFDHISTLKAGSYAVAASISSNQDYVAGVLPALAMRTFAYPFGDVSIGAKLHLRRRFGASRGVRPGFNGRQLELTNLRSFPLEHLHSRCQPQSQSLRLLSGRSRAPYRQGI